MRVNLKYNEWVQLPYTKGTVENINTQALIEVNSVEAASGVVLYPSQRLRFDEQLYARSLWDNDGVIANVVDFAESGGDGGGGGGSTIDLRPAINAVNTTLQEINTNVSVVGGLASETTHERIADALESLDERMDKIGICSIPYGARRNNTAYQVGDIAYSYNLPPYLRLECVKAGTTAATEPDFSQISGGGIVSDGTILWIVDDVRDGTPVGQVRASMFVPAGYVKLEGGTVNRENYPRLVALADAYNLWTSDTANNPGLFGEGDGATTMVLPNWTGRMAQFANTAGGKVDAGLPNITGEIAWASGNGVGTSGAFLTQATAANRGYVTTANTSYNTRFDASRSNPIYGNSIIVQPPAINVFAIMRY